MWSESTDTKIRSTASDILNRIMEFYVHFCFVVASNIFEVTDRLNTCLQAKNASSGEGVQLVAHTLLEYNIFRTDDAFEEVWTSSLSVVQEIGVDEPQLSRQVRAHRRLQ